MRTATASMKSTVMMVILALFTFVLAPNGSAQSVQPSQEDGGTASEAGLGAASLFLTLPYGVTKVTFAAAGVIVGGLAYLFSGFDEATAKRIWTTSAYGTYILTPGHLKGDQPIRFLGVEDEPVNGQADNSSH